jgi:hypothetical protein
MRCVGKLSLLCHVALNLVWYCCDGELYLLFLYIIFFCKKHIFPFPLRKAKLTGDFSKNWQNAVTTVPLFFLLYNAPIHWRTESNDWEKMPEI